MEKKEKSSVIKPNIKAERYLLHMGPFLPINAAGVNQNTATSAHVIESKTTIKISSVV